MSFACGYGQSISLLYNDAVVADMDTLTIEVIKPEDHYIDLVNTSEQDINLMIRRELVNVMQNVITYFCFEDCYNETVDISDKPYSFKAGDTCSTDNKNNPYFYVHYDPQNQNGTSIIKFNFYDDDNPSDKSSVIFKFISTTTGIADNQLTQVSLNAYPNPATTKVVIQHDLKNQVSGETRLLLSNVMGATVKSIPISSTSGKTQIDVSDLASGIYFYSIATGGKISGTKKLIVK
jgi:hypothetical protein